MHAYAAALGFLARRRLTEAQLRARLERRGYDDDAIGAAVSRCKEERYLDDALFAALYIERARDAKGDRRLVGELIRRGLDAQSAQRALAEASHSERDRCIEALAKLRRTQPRASYPSLARSLERRGFPASLIYAILREAALLDGALDGIADGSSSESELHDPLDAPASR